MKIDRRMLVAGASVGAIVVAVLVALAVGPRGYRGYLAVSALVSIAMAVSSVVAEPRELLVALGFGTPPIMALVTEGAPTWMIAPLAALLLLGGELNAWSWELGGPDAEPAAVRARAVSIARLAGVALASALLITAVSRVSFLGGTLAVLVAAGGLVALGVLVLPGSGRPVVAETSVGETKSGTMASGG